MIWFAAVAAIAFAIPFVGTSLLEMQHDAYLAVYFVAVLGVLFAYARSTSADLRTLFGKRALASLAVGVVVLVFLTFNVLSEDSTARPDGAYFIFEIFWRGIAYGAVDALLLTAFPCVIVLSLLEWDIGSWRRKFIYVSGSLVAIIAITAIYHLGFEQYREDGVKGPEIGNVIISVPMLATTNPVGSIVDHAGMHVAAVVHAYETELRLPPAVSAEN